MQKQNKKRVFLQLFFVLFFWMAFSGQMCTKAIVYGRNYNTNPWKAYFETDNASVVSSLEKAFAKFGYEVVESDSSRGRFLTGWRPVEADSHYFNMFERRDYGISDGAYYQMQVDLSQESEQVKVVISTTVKSISGPLESSGKVEKRLLTQLQDFLRSPQIEMTNVGIENR